MKAGTRVQIIGLTSVGRDWLDILPISLIGQTGILAEDISNTRFKSSPWVFCYFIPDNKQLLNSVSKIAIYKALLKKLPPLTEATQCEACGALDSIISNGDAGICTECGTPENYKTVYVDESGEVIKDA